MLKNQYCRLCKKEKGEQQFLKNGRTLKSCEDCRLVVREAKLLRKQKKSDDSGSSSDDNTTLEPVEEPVEEPTEDVGVEETKEEPVPDVQEPVPDVEDVPDVEENELVEEVFEKINKPKRTRKVPQNSPVTEPTKLVLTRTKTVPKEKNLPSTKRTKKPRAKKE